MKLSTITILFLLSFSAVAGPDINEPTFKIGEIAMINGIPISELGGGAFTGEGSSKPVEKIKTVYQVKENKTPSILPHYHGAKRNIRKANNKAIQSMIKSQRK